MVVAPATNLGGTQWFQVYRNSFLTTALMTGLASAQTNTGNKDTASAPSTRKANGEPETRSVDVYNEANEKLAISTM